MPQQPRQEVLRLLRRIHLPELITDPEQAESWLLHNVLQITLASLYVLGADELVQLRATSDGLLRVEVGNEPPTTADSYNGTAADAYSAYQVFDGECVGVILIAETHPLDVSLRNPDAVDQDAIYVPADTGLSVPFAASGFRVKNNSAGDNSVWHVLALI